MEDQPHGQHDGRIAGLKERVCVIVNPASGRGRGRQMLPAIRAAFAAHGVTDVRATCESRDESRLARMAVADGCSTIICVGGDGTTGNVANAILHSGADTRLGVIPAGTGNDFAKTLGTDGRSLEVVARRSVDRDDTRVDVGRVEDTFFLNSCGFGFDVAVLERLGETRWLRGRALYLYAALAQLLEFRGLHISLECPGRKQERTLYMMLVIANGPYFGGAFLIAPEAAITDGELDAVSILDASATQRISILASATRGRHALSRDVRVDRAAEFTIGFDEIPSYEADGEIHRASSSTLAVGCVPSALRVVTGDLGLRLPHERTSGTGLKR